MENKIRIKMGEVEVEYEGSEAFLKKELASILDAVAKLHSAGEHVTTSKKHESRDSGRRNVARNDVSTSVIATKLGSKTGPNLILAAGGKLTLVDGQETFSRDSILTEMRSASAFYKRTYVNNMTVYLKSLVKNGLLNEFGGEKYSLSGSGRTKVESALGHA